MKRSASAVWQGDLRQGKGTLSTESGVLEKTPYSFRTGFENEKGTNPEELIAAAHAGCFAMALSGILSRAGFSPEELAAQSTVSLEQVEGAWTITSVALRLDAKVPGLEKARFDELADEAKRSCPVSRLLKANISLQAMLRS